MMYLLYYHTLYIILSFALQYKERRNQVLIQRIKKRQHLVCKLAEKSDLVKEQPLLASDRERKRPVHKLCMQISYGLAGYNARMRNKLGANF